MKRIIAIFLFILACSVFGCASFDKQAELSAKLDAEVVGQSKDAIYSFTPPFEGSKMIDSFLPFYKWDCGGEKDAHIACGWRWRALRDKVQRTSVSFWLQNGTVASYEFINEYHDVR